MRDLQTIVEQDGPLGFELAAQYVAQAAEQLEYVHRAGIIHGAVQPENLLVEGLGLVHVLNWWRAQRRADTPFMAAGNDEIERRQASADYLSPEQALNSHRFDRRADIYSLGCTFYFALTGHAPFPEGSIPQRLMMHQTKAPQSIFEDRPDAPRELVAICERMMAKSPESRQQTAAEVARELYFWLGGRWPWGRPV